MTQQTWPAIALARPCDGPARVPFVLMDEQGPVLGSVAVDHLDALGEWPDAFERIGEPGGVPRALALRLPLRARDARLAQVHERLHVFDLELPAGLAPRNIDGEVHEHRLMPVAEVLARCAAGELTTDATLATLDFAVRRGLVEPSSRLGESTLTRAQLQAFEALRP